MGGNKIDEGDERGPQQVIIISGYIATSNPFHILHSCLIHGQYINDEFHFFLIYTKQKFTSKCVKLKLVKSFCCKILLLKVSARHFKLYKLYLILEVGIHLRYV